MGLEKVENGPEPKGTSAKWRRYWIMVLFQCLVVSFTMTFSVFALVHVKSLKDEVNALAIEVERLKGLYSHTEFVGNSYENYDTYSDNETGTTNIISPSIVQEEEDYDLLYYDDVVPNFLDPGRTELNSKKMDQPENLTKVGHEEHRERRDVSDDGPLTNTPELSDEIKGYNQKRSGDVYLKPIRQNLTYTYGQYFKVPQVKSVDDAQWEPVTPFQSVPPPTHHHRRNRGRQRHQNNYETFEERPQRPRPPLPAIHFSGNTARYGDSHPNYFGNDLLSHPGQTYVDWEPSEWTRSVGSDQHFHMQDGFLKVKENGLYFVYAQIYFSDRHDTNGYKVFKNNETELLQCTITTHTRDHEANSNTCYTAGMEFLEEGDRLNIKDIARGRRSIFAPGKSFFGVVKLG